MTERALVLAGGGVAGIAWETGLLLGIQGAAPSAAQWIAADSTRLIGTSAGATVAAQLASGSALSALFALQISEESAELSVELDLEEFGAMMGRLMSEATSAEDARKRLGAVARAAETPSPATRRAVIMARLPVHSWSVRDTLITAVDTATGELRVFNRESGVDLVDAVAASSAVPGIWPPVEIEGRFYMDGGMRSVANADLAAGGADKVLILVPASEISATGEPSLAPTELDALNGARVHCVFADENSLQAFGMNPLDPTTRPASAEAGRMQGRRIGSTIAAFWD